MDYLLKMYSSVFKDVLPPKDYYPQWIHLLGNTLKIDPSLCIIGRFAQIEKELNLCIKV